MIRSIVAAVVRALKAIAGFARRVAAAPFLALANAFGGGGEPAVPPVPAVSDETDDAPAPTQDMTKVYEQIALAVMQWCIDSLVADHPVPAPPKAPRAIAEWLQGLTREECIAIASADKSSVSAHLRCYEILQSVRSVRPLERVEWPPEPALDLGPGGAFSDHVRADTETSADAPSAPVYTVPGC